MKLFGKYRKPKIASEPLVSIKLRKNGDLHIFALSLLKGIAGVPSEPYFAHTLNDDLAVLGNSIVSAKSGSLGYLERENYLEYVPPYYEWAGVKDGRQYSKGTKSLAIQFYADQIKFSPTTNKKGIWYGIPDKEASLVSTSSPEEIAEQMLKSLEDCVM